MNSILSSDEDLETKLLQSIEILRSVLLRSAGGLEVDAYAGGLKATFKDEDGEGFVFKVTKSECESEDVSEASDDISTPLRYSTDYREIRLIGEGAFGRAFLCKHKLDGGDYVVKKVTFAEHNRERKLKEVLSLKMAQHENVVRYYQSWTEEDTLFIAMDYYPMTLRDKMMNNSEESECLRFFKQLMKGLKHVHEIGIIHFDVKPENLFVDKLNNLKIGDFGVAASTGKSYGENFGGKYQGFQTLFRAPEIKLSSQNLSNKVDIYSAGCVLLDMLVCMNPNDDRSTAFSDAESGYFPEVSDINITHILKKCLQRDPTKRPSANQILIEHLNQ